MAIFPTVTRSGWCSRKASTDGWGRTQKLITKATYQVSVESGGNEQLKELMHFLAEPGGDLVAERPPGWEIERHARTGSEHKNRPPPNHLRITTTGNAL